jgi:FkbM family methyltransferase
LSADSARALYAAAIAPERDPLFVANNVHGAERQYTLLKQAVRFAKNRRVAVDVGAHIGLWTIGLLQFFARVEAFEPVLENYAKLDMNLPQEHVALHMLALADRPGHVKMVLPPGGNSGMWRAERGAHGPVVACMLDEFHLQDVDFIKIDVEGMEGAVLRGARNTLERCKPVVFFESNGLRCNEWIDPKMELEDAGYQPIVRLQKNELWAHRLSR